MRFQLTSSFLNQFTLRVNLRLISKYIDFSQSFLRVGKKKPEVCGEFPEYNGKLLESVHRVRRSIQKC